MNGFWDMVDPLSLPAYQSGPSEGQLMMGLRFRFSRTFQAEGRSQPSVSVLAGCAEFAGALSAAGTVFVTTVLRKVRLFRAVRCRPTGQRGDGQRNLDLCSACCRVAIFELT